MMIWKYESMKVRNTEQAFSEMMFSFIYTFLIHNVSYSCSRSTINQEIQRNFSFVVYTYTMFPFIIKTYI